jgi:predicted acyltransferase (DUF342 family)
MRSKAGMATTQPFITNENVSGNIIQETHTAGLETTKPIMSGQQNFGTTNLIQNEGFAQGIQGAGLVTEGLSTSSTMQNLQTGNIIQGATTVQAGQHHEHETTSDTKVFTSQVPVTKQIPVTEYVTQTKTIPVTKEVEVIKNVPIEKQVQYTENVSVKETVPVTRMEERVKTVPVTKNVEYVETVTQTTQVPVTRIEERVKTVPVTKTHQIVEQVPVKTTVPVTEQVEVTKSVPVTRTKQVVENVEVKSTVPVTENVTVTKQVPITRNVEVVQHVPITGSIQTDARIYAQEGINTSNLINTQTHGHHLNQHGLHGQTTLLNQNLGSNLQTNFNTQPLLNQTTLIEGQQLYNSGLTTGIPTTMPVQGSGIVETGYSSGIQTGIPTTVPIQGQTFIEGQSHLYKGGHLHGQGIRTVDPITTGVNNLNLNTNTVPLTTNVVDVPITTAPIVGGVSSNYRGIPGCKICHGVGYRKSKKHAHMKACKPCVKATGQCGVCSNSGIRMDDHKPCTCYYAK